jgi:site-specific DNA-methyltransferase (adenine-specific)
MSSKFKKITPKSNTIYRGDNLEVMRAMPDSFVDLCYIDPPFFTQKDYKNIWGDKESVLDWGKSKLDGFFDTKDFFEKHVHNGEKGLSAYLAWLRPRIQEVHRLLKPNGTFFLHLDYHAVHYAKVICDEIFGYKNFKNEIVWRRKIGSNSAGTPRRLSTNTDTVLFYAKGNSHIFNPQYQPNDPEYLKKFYRHDDEDGRGPYQLDNIGAPSYSPTLIYDYKGFKPPEKGWRYNLEKMKALDKDGRIYFPEDKKGRPRLKRYLNENKGKIIENIWDDIGMLHDKSPEKMKWPTQKPVALLERIVSMCSNEGDMIFDCFAGCGTSMHAAHKLKRKWVGIDISPTAMKVNKKRLEDLNAKVHIIDERDLEISSEYKNSKKAS